VKLILVSFFVFLNFQLAFADEKLKVVTTFTVIADIAQNVAGEAAEVVSITKPGAEIHGYQPTPKDLVRAYDADLILWNGLNLELWFEKFISQLGNVNSRRGICWTC
jgi:manganese/iron transport system substrate-binding protein